MEIGWCTDKEKYDGSALSVCAIIDEGMKTHCPKRLMTVDSNMKVEEVHKGGDHEDMDAKLQEAWDDVSAALDPKERKTSFWTRSLRRGYKIRWIDVNKGRQHQLEMWK